MSKNNKLIVRSSYPCGPCPSNGPLTCTCGLLLTEDNIVIDPCNDECEICQYCGPRKCIRCGEHIHCGGCI